MPPYTQVLSALCKNDLIRLCTEFRLGPIVNLRNRLKDYLNLHRDMLFHNPRYNALFPRHRRLNQPRQPSTPSRTPTPSSCASTPPASNHSHLPALSYASWHGIGGHDANHDKDQLDAHVIQPPPVPVQHKQQPHFLSPHPLLEHPYNHHIPPPSNPPLNSEHTSVPPAAYPVDGCKYSCLSQIACLYMALFSLFWDIILPYFWTLWSPFRLLGTMQPPLFARHYEVIETLCSLSLLYMYCLSEKLCTLVFFPSYSRIVGCLFLVP